MPPPKHYLPPMEKRMCVSLGLAVVHLEEAGYRIRYDWPALLIHWKAWRNPSLADFCRYYDVPYMLATKKGLTAQARQQSAMIVGSRGYREMALHRAVVAEVYEKGGEGDQLSEALVKLLQIARVGAVYAREKLTRQVEGGMAPNMAASPRDVNHLMTIGWKAAGILRTVQELVSAMDPAGSNTPPVPVPTKLAKNTAPPPTPAKPKGPARADV